MNGSTQHVSIWKWDSLPFGETLANANPSNLGVMTFNHRLPGQYRDSETGLHQNWNREYDPKLRRYVESDPIGLSGGINTYSYALSRPVQATDPNGLEVPVDPIALLNGLANAIGKTPGELLGKFGCKKAEEGVAAIKGLKAAVQGMCKSPGNAALRHDSEIAACTLGLGVTTITGFGQYIDTCVPIVVEFAGSPGFAAGCASLSGGK